MHSAFGYIAVMAVVTYLIRMIPLVLLKKEITNTWVKSFLYYVPYVTLAVMTFPAILEAIQLQVTSYLNGNLAIQMVTWESGDPEPWATLTVNLPGQRQKDHAFIDTNADSEFPTWLIRHGLAIPTGRTMQSGFCTYPEYRFRANRLQELDPEGYAGYLKNFERRCSA